MLVPEPEQDVVIGRLARHLGERQPFDGHPFGSLQEMCDLWAHWFAQDFETDNRGLDPGIAREGTAMLRELPRSAERRVLLCKATRCASPRVASHPDTATAGNAVKAPFDGMESSS
ncbi:MAG: hypothetical protein M3Y17_02225 [Actinomycetota bacterium]|nr:hypothetical protein [Actinomycetota bacterium]